MATKPHPLFSARFNRKLAKENTKQSLGLLNDTDAARMASREPGNMKYWGISEGMLPQSVPDEEEMLKARRRSIARQRRRSGRMSTILTGGLGGDTPTTLGV